jgi:predicted O-methyltransferase YrrM
MQDVKRAANGMLPVRVYERLTTLACRTRPAVIVEVDTAHGAATIAMATGCKAAGAAFHLYTADPFSGFSSRAALGGVEDNLRVVDATLRQFGVADCVTVVVGTVIDLLPRIPAGAVELLLIDADGRIDRDLAAIYDRLSPGAGIVIDDVDGDVCLTRFAYRLHCDQKHRLTRLIVDRLLASGHLVNEHVECSTGFFSKGQGTAAASESPAFPAYRELVFEEIDAIAVAKRQSVIPPRHLQGRDVYQSCGSTVHCREGLRHGRPEQGHLMLL